MADAVFADDCEPREGRFSRPSIQDERDTAWSNRMAHRMTADQFIAACYCAALVCLVLAIEIWPHEVVPQTAAERLVILHEEYLARKAKHQKYSHILQEMQRLRHADLVNG